ncbi:MAG: phosphate ABC transporter, permease protein PstA, partial [Planctomycetota bacterium]
MTTPAALENVDPEFQAKNASRRRALSTAFYGVCVAVAMLSVIVLIVLLASIGYQGQGRLTADLVKNAHSELTPASAGMGPSIIGSLAVVFVCALFAIPLGVGTAIFLEEFKPKAKLLQYLRGFLQLNIANLAGVPSIVYGLLGLSVFVYMFNVFGRIQVNESSGIEIVGVDHYYQVLTLESGVTVFIPQTDRS